MNPLLSIANVILLLGVLLLGAGILAWRSCAVCGWPVRLAICTLRLCGIALLAVPLLNPGQWISPPAESHKEWAVLVDASGSMATRDVDGATRLEAAQNIAREAEKLAASLKKPLSSYAFDGAALRALSPRESPSEAGTTDIAGAIAALVSRYSAGSPALDGVLVLSDGRQVAATPPEEAIFPARSAEVRIFSIPLGGPVTPPDLEVQIGRRQYTVFKGQELPVHATISAHHATPRNVVVRLLDAADNVREKKSVRLDASQPTPVDFLLTELAPGYQDFRLEVEAIEGEKELLNNRARFGVQVLDETVRVLLVEGSPYWDTKFIAQLLQRERNYALELVYRLSAERFFSLATSDGNHDLAMVQRAAFPATADELAAYDLIVLGRSVEGFLDPLKAGLLADWVKKGGAMVLARGNPVTTPVPALEPLFPMVWDLPVEGNFSWRPTATGEDAGLFGADLPARNSPLWGRLPPLHEATSGSELKPFAQVLVEGVSSQGQRESRFPLLVSRRFGEGHVVSVNCDDLWRWEFFPAIPEAAPLYKDFWLRLFNWVVSYSDFLPGRNFALKASHQSIEAGKPVRIRILRRPGTEENAVPQLIVKRDGAEVSQIEPASHAANPDQWDAVFPLVEPGLYTVELRVGEEPDPLHATIAAVSPPDEGTVLSADPSSLQNLSEKSGGKVLERGDLKAMFEERPLPPSEGNGAAEWKSSWDSPAWLLPMLAFFSGEWFLRRRQGLI